MGSKRPGGPCLDWVLCTSYLAIISGQTDRQSMAYSITVQQGRSKVSLADQAGKPASMHAETTTHTAHVGRLLLKLKLTTTAPLACRHLRPRCPDCDGCWLGNLDFRPMWCVALQLCFFFVCSRCGWSDDPRCAVSPWLLSLICLRVSSRVPGCSWWRKRVVQSLSQSGGLDGQSVRGQNGGDLHRVPAAD